MPDILMYGEVGWDITDRGVAEELRAADGADVTLRVNSPGGDVWTGRTIMNALREYPGTVTAVVEGIAASAASFIAIGGADRVTMRPGTSLMIHDALSFRGGNAAEQRAEADALDRESDEIAAVYAGKAGGDAAEWRARMVEETWYSAAEAVDAGLADAVEDARQAAEPAPVDALGRGRVVALFRYRSRADAPDPTLNSPSGHERKESHVDALMKKEIRNVIREILAEEVTLTSTIDITYPEGTTVVPTGSVTITPGNGEPTPPGLTFALDTAPDGWTVEVDAETGALTVTAPSGAEPDETVEITISVTGNDDPVILTAPVTVTAAGGDTESGTSTDPAPDTLTTQVDTARLAELEEAAAYGRAAMERDHAAKAQAFADAAFRDNKIGGAARKRWASAWLADREDAETRMAQIPAGSVHRAEAGHARTDKDAVDAATTEIEERVRRSLNR